MDVVELAVAERTDLLELARSLTPEQWAAPSLCRGWTVLDVVAHVVSFDDLSPGSWPAGRCGDARGRTR